MKKSVKALISHEGYRNRWVFAYMLLTVAICLGVTHLSLETQKYDLLSKGFFRVNLVGNLFMSKIQAISGWMFIGLGIGVMILLYRQFQEERNHEIGRFLRSLPIEGKWYFIIRLVSGLSMITLSFIAYGLGIWILKGIHNEWIEDYYIKMDPSGWVGIYDTMIHVGIIVLMMYLIIVLLYSLLLLFQYLINSPVVAMICGIGAGFFPWFIVEAYGAIYDKAIYGSWFKYLRPWGYTMDYNWIDYWMYHTSGTYTRNYLIKSIQDIEIKLLILCIGTLVCLVGAYLASRASRIEYSYRLMPLCSIRWIFVGAIVSVAFFAGSVLSIMFGYEPLPVWINILLATIGGWIAFKISGKGLQAKGGI